MGVMGLSHTLTHSLTHSHSSLTHPLTLTHSFGHPLTRHSLTHPPSPHFTHIAVAGTEADYRSKSMAQLRELLRKEASLFTRDVPLDIVLQYGRWQMVAFLKEINNLRFEEGDTSKAAHFRLNLKSARQRVEGNAVAARAVFEKQRAALRVAPAGGGGEEGGGEGEGEAGQSGGTSVRTGRKSGVSGKRVSG